jgi:hypothetical protein
LPLFTHLDENRVRARVQDERVKPRPTLHYRLPNSEIDRTDWDIALPWGEWLFVERLAADPPRLERLCRRYSQHLNDPIEKLTSDWRVLCNAWLSENGLL